MQLKRYPDAIDQSTSDDFGGQSIFVKADNQSHPNRRCNCRGAVLKCSLLRKDKEMHIEKHEMRIRTKIDMRRVGRRKRGGGEEEREEPIQVEATRHLNCTLFPETTRKERNSLK